MAIPAAVGIGVAVVKTIASAYSTYRKFKDKRQEAEFQSEVIQRLKEICNSLEQVEQAVIEGINKLHIEMRRIRLADLQGDVNQIRTLLKEYEIYDKETHNFQWQQELKNLQEIRLKSAGVIGDLESEFNSLNFEKDPDLNHAIILFNLYATVIPFRATVLKEISYTYQMNYEDDIPPMFESAKPYASRLDSALQNNIRKQVPSRFSNNCKTQTTERHFAGETEYFTILYYEFDGIGQTTCRASSIGSRPLLSNNDWKECREKLEAHKKKVFKQMLEEHSVIFEVLNKLR